MSDSSQRFLTLIIVAFAVLATGCSVLSRTDPEPTPAPFLGTNSEAPLAGVGTLICSQTCADQAQCGQAIDLEASVVLLNSAGPALDSHNLIVGSGLPTEIREHMDVDVIRDGTQNPQSMRFYKVAVRDGDTDRGEAWVAGWCIQQP